MSRLTDEQIDGLQRFVDGDDGPRSVHMVWLNRALAELRDRRAADAIAVSDGSAAVVTLGTKSLDAMLASERRAADLTPRDRELCDRALGIWTSDHNDAPHDEIAALRDRLLSQKAGG